MSGYAPVAEPTGTRCNRRKYNLKFCQVKFFFFFYNVSKRTTSTLSMKRVSGQIVTLLWLIHLAAAGTLWELEEDVRKNRTLRDISCKAGTYPHEGICCLKCPAGNYVKAHCTETLKEGSCETCDYDTYTEHENGLSQCLSCTKCPPDQKATKACTPVSDTECQCKPGSFCLPHHACEVCKRCSKCKEGEFEKKQCTPTSNTICEKKKAVNTTVIVVIVVITVLILVLGAFVFWKTLPHKLRDALRRKDTHQRNLERNVRVVEDRPATKEPIHRAVKQLVGSAAPEDEDTGLGESLPNTASSSQASLSALPPPPSHTPLSCSSSSSGNSSSTPPNPLTQPLLRVTEQTPGIPRLVPLNGDDSLRKSFDLFEEVDVLFHKRFFRHLGLTDNDIRGVENNCSDDKIYALLRIWMEREGMKASINNLIDALLFLDQRFSAENIIEKAVEGGFYKYEAA
ncbi:hematopoietic death receptor isoform X1 [Sardina pilchardus]|uniref:hematopoietic death receptor isoform X1 n=1 Tax=Sardina pilchardus TaxID=27697 RepID=UPI002E13CFA5